MTRFQKKCLIFSVGLHGLLVVILFASAGFSSSPPPMDLQVMTLIPANIVDRAGAGGGTPALNIVPLPHPQPAPAPQTVQTEQVDRVEMATPLPQRREPTHPLPPRDEPKETRDIALEPSPKMTKSASRHEIHVSYTPANGARGAKKAEKSSPSTSLAKAEGLRRREIENALAGLASNVRSSGSSSTIVDVAGIGGGAAFAGYRDAVFSAYYHAWITPENNPGRPPVARVTIARDGSVISAEIERHSDNEELDRSVQRALLEVIKLPPFPDSTQDAQRTFVIRFIPDPKTKELAG